jgi:agmatine deiminase
LDGLRADCELKVSTASDIPYAAFLEDLQQAIADIANTVAQFEPVVMLMHRDFAASARGKLAENVDIGNIPTDGLWCRDSGPVFVKDDDGRLAVTHLNFKGWGGKQVHGNDGKVARRVAQRLELPIHDNGLVGEAESAEFD